MTDPAPAPTPEPPPPTVDPPSQRGRPSKVVERDLAVARMLAEREQSLHDVMAALGLEWRITYNSVCRLRDRGLVVLNRNGTRTPTWKVTNRGHEWLGTPVPTVEPDAPTVPSVEPAPEPTPEVVAEVPPPAEPEVVVHVPTVALEPGAQPVPISPPPPEEPVGVPPSPGAAEPVWPV